MEGEVSKALRANRGPVNELALNFGILLLIMLAGGFLTGFLAKSLRLPDKLMRGFIGIGVLGGIYFWAQTPLAH
ncbi:hypothetical protein [Sediminibacillus albus]|uniref:Uncharacterized protein n=1 Tax=Sediminibacillus albus TaxID=407036 RepID=A0A1G8X6E4_9BACI|nr:hypothetical protein [Sediminibacillus albus]SDJ85957.1 hypothetical protein SAMN05216243_1179 [Sediminibacillus albus]